MHSEERTPGDQEPGRPHLPAGKGSSASGWGRGSDAVFAL